MVTADQFVAHLVGDYVLQSDWMAAEKTKKSVAAAAHAFVYTMSFLLITRSPAAIAVIMVTHFIIDRWRLARYVCWLKNFLAPRSSKAIIPPNFVELVWWHPWSECEATGYHKDKPPWLTVWLMIIADNTMHILINGLAIYFLG